MAAPHLAGCCSVSRAMPPARAHSAGAARPRGGSCAAPPGSRGVPPVLTRGARVERCEGPGGLCLGSTLNTAHPARCVRRREPGQVRARQCAEHAVSGRGERMRATVRFGRDAQTSTPRLPVLGVSPPMDHSKDDDLIGHGMEVDRAVPRTSHGRPVPPARPAAGEPDEGSRASQELPPHLIPGDC